MPKKPLKYLKRAGLRRAPFLKSDGNGHELPRNLHPQPVIWETSNGHVCIKIAIYIFDDFIYSWWIWFRPFARNKSDQTLLHMVALQVTRVLWCPLIKIGKVFKSMCNNAIICCIFYIDIVVRHFSKIYASQHHNLPPTFPVRYFWNYNSKISKSSKKNRVI